MRIFHDSEPEPESEIQIKTLITCSVAILVYEISYIDDVPFVHSLQTAFGVIAIAEMSTNYQIFIVSSIVCL